MSIFRRLKKKILKRWARNAFFPGWRVRLLRWCGFSIGKDVYIGDDFIVVEELADRDNLLIGDRVSVAPRVTIVTSSHPNNSLIRGDHTTTSGPVTIEADAWLGAGCVLLPGVTIGRGAVVGALSVVTSDVPPLTVVAGQPAHEIKKLPVPKGWE